jgi:hypothetical protein
MFLEALKASSPERIPNRLALMLISAYTQPFRVEECECLISSSLFPAKGLSSGKSARETRIVMIIAATTDCKVAVDWLFLDVF